LIPRETTAQLCEIHFALDPAVMRAPRDDVNGASAHDGCGYRLVRGLFCSYGRRTGTGRSLWHLPDGTVRLGEPLTNALLRVAGWDMGMDMPIDGPA